MGEGIVNRLLADQPKFHAFGSTLMNYSAHPAVLRYLAGLVSTDTVSLETGCGYSTVAMIAGGGEHYCITPAAAEVERVREYCEGAGISIERAHFIIESSDIELPRLQLPRPADLVFIDGEHSFPYPVVDWHYAAKLLRIGGVVGIDDIQIPACGMLADFLALEPNWLQESGIDRTKFFIKARETLTGWRYQPYNTFPAYLEGLPLTRLVGLSVGRVFAYAQMRLRR